LDKFVKIKNSRIRSYKYLTFNPNNISYKELISMDYVSIRIDEEQNRDIVLMDNENFYIEREEQFNI